MQFTKSMIIKKIAKVVGIVTLTGAVAFTGAQFMIPAGSDVAYADRQGEDYYNAVSSAMMELDEYLKTICLGYSFSPEDEEKLKEIYDDGRNYIANNAWFENFDIESYVKTVESRMESFAKTYGIVNGPTSDTTKYIGLYSNLDVVHVKGGESCMIVLPFVNYSDVDLYNVVIKPQVSTDKTKWPFEITKSGESEVIPYLPGNESRETVYDNRMEIGWIWTALKDATTGYYELPFAVTYERNGKTENTTVSAYVYVDGVNANVTPTATPANVSTPRIIVTGFETNPEKVFAGDTFELTIHVKNTSDRSSVSNILFALEAQTQSDGNNSVAGVAPFLPTSGSSNIYVSKIGEGKSEDITIEMTARADLGQKPYVLVVNMSYEDEEAKPYTSQTNVSIPIYQQARYEISSATVEPGNIFVGETSNIMLNVYNTGKTTLYNVSVKFDQNEVSGGDVFIGKLDAGATGKVDTEVTGSVPNDGSLTMYLCYEDENGQQTVIENELALFIEDAPIYDDSSYDFPEPEEEVVQEGMPVWVIILIAVGGLLVVGGVVFVVLMKVKKKKKLLEEIESSNDEEIL